MSSIGERIKQRRLSLNLSQEALAQIIRTDYKAVWRWESGKYSPSTEMLIELAYALDTTPDWLLGFEDEPDRPLETLSDDEREWLRVWRGKKADDRKKLLEVVKLL